MEAGIVDHIRMVLDGRPLYREPSFEWTPFIYGWPKTAFAARPAEVWVAK